MKRKTLSVLDKSYWKLLKVKAELRAETWDELIDKIYEMVVKK